MKINIKTLVLLLLTFLSMLQARSQNTKIDSLDILIKRAISDTSRINLILYKLDVLSAINLDSAIHLALKTLEETQKMRYYQGEVAVREKLVYNYSYKGNFKAASEELDNLEGLLKPGKDSADFANFYASKGLLYGMQSKYDSSIYYYEKAIPIFERTGERKRLSACYSNIAIGFQQQSNLSGALYYQQKSLKLYEEDKNETGQAYTYVNMANTYQKMGDIERSESTFLRSIELAKENELANVELYAYTNLSNLYMDQLSWQKSHEYSIKAADLGGKMGDQGIQAASLSKGSTAMVYLNQPEEALALSQKAIALADLSGQPLIISQAYSSMGLVLKSQKKWKEAIPFYERGLESLTDADLFTQNNGRLYKELSECYENTGNYSKSLTLFKQSAMITDSVRSRENIKKATELMMNYEFEKKEEAAKSLQAAKDEIMHTRQVALIIGLVLSMILIAGALAGYFGKKKANELLRNQKQEIEETLTKLKSTQAQLIQSEKMASLGELTAGIAHEIQNPLNFVNNFSEVSSELLDEMHEELEKGEFDEAKSIASDIKQNLEKITHHGKRADAIVKGMLEHSRASSGDKVPTDINALADEYLRLSYHGLRARDKSFNASFEMDFDPNLPKVEVVQQDIGRVLLNLINNAFYAVNEKAKENDPGFSPTVKVSTRFTGRSVEMMISDNGMGIPDQIKNKIFQPFFTTKPTGQGTGLGLSMSYDIVTKGHGGEIKVETKEGEGSEFIIALPFKINQ
jgi:two-component system, NtrC family, sensor kinase